MTFKEAIEHVEAGGKATCDRLAPAVLKLQDGIIRAVFEQTGSGYSFRFSDEWKELDWRKVGGWASYT